MLPIILYTNKLLTATLTASGTYAGYDVQNILDQRTSTYWKAAAAGSANYIRGQWGSAQAVNCVGICSHNLFTVGATIYVEHSDNGTNWTQAATLTPVSDELILLSFTSATKTYWRLKIANSSGIPQIAVLFFGIAVEFEYPPEGPIAILDEGINAESNQSEKGNLLGSVVRFNDAGPLDRSFTNFTKNFYINSLKPFWSYAKLLNHFFYADDLTNAPDEIHYCRLKSDYRFRPEKEIKDYISTFTLNMICEK